MCFTPQTRPGFATRQPALLMLLLGLTLLPGVAKAQAPATLKIDVLEGEGAINNIHQRRAKEPVVRVVDEKNQPVRGASVTFLLPDMGPSGAFQGDVRELALQTDDKGQAVGRGLVPNQMTGKFQIRVVASYQGQRANAVINQVNAEPGGALSSGPSKKVLLIALIGGAAAGGIALAMSHGGGGGSSPSSIQPTGSGNPTGIVISAGSPVFQTPH